MRKTILGLLSILGIPLSVYAHNYAEGQVWEYTTRGNEAGSKLYIVKVEKLDDKNRAYHIALDGLKVKNPLIKDGGVQSDLPHLPVSKQSLDKSVTKLATRHEVYDGWQAGYQEWRQAYLVGDAGLFTIPVNQIVDLVESTIAN
jgi:hypothetical protein